MPLLRSARGLTDTGVTQSLGMAGFHHAVSRGQSNVTAHVRPFKRLPLTVPLPIDQAWVRGPNSYRYEIIDSPAARRASDHLPITVSWG